VSSVTGPVGTDDIESPVGSSDVPQPAAIEVTPSREADVGGHRVRRALPRRARRTVGAWCFVDHMGPASVSGSTGAGIGPHPHTGLQTVTWLVAGELRHRDSLGSDQVIKPGQLNLMTAGDGVAHAEEGTAYRGELHGVQLWVAQPEATRHGSPAFEHHAELPRTELGGAVATVLVGELDGAASPARRDTDHGGFDLSLQAGRSVLPLRPEFEHAIVVLSGAVLVDGSVVEPGHLGYLSPGRDELVVEAQAATRALVVGGIPFPSPIFMWWNFVARTREEAEAAGAAWNGRDERFGEVDSTLDRIAAPVPPWSGSGGSGSGGAGPAR
jgi:redox-sensitive bicupin YhaK (pirin superfamily)